MVHSFKSITRLLRRATTRSTWPVILAVGVLLGVGHVTPTVAQSSRALQVRAARSQLKADNPGLRMLKTGDRITRLYGRSFGSGSSVEAVAEHFRQNRAMAFGVEPNNLKRGGRAYKGRFTQQVMLDRNTGKYKFTLVYYNQHKGNVPVFRSDLRLLIRNEDNRLVWANSSVRDLGDYDLPPGAAATNAGNVAQSFQDPDFPSPDFVRDARTIVWAGSGDDVTTPKLAVEFIAGDNGIGGELRSYVIDAETGELLGRENLIMQATASGNVSGKASDISASSWCDTARALKPLPYARVELIDGSDTTVIYADAEGYFSQDGLNETSVTVRSQIWGEWFRVYNSVGDESDLSEAMVPSGSVDFIFNDTDSENVRAEVNAYVFANKIRDFVLTYDTAFPGLDNSPMSLTVNHTTGNCPDNAWYNPLSEELVFCQSTGTRTSDAGYANTAFDFVVYHEYGHHVVSQVIGAAVQGAYGEGMGDCLAVLITDQSVVAKGNRGESDPLGSPCDHHWRDSDTTTQYPAITEEIHKAGTLLSSCVWDLRDTLAVVHPSNYTDTLANLVISSILLHGDYTINPQITLDFLTLDDDNGDFSDGTLHWAEILWAFGNHNMDPFDKSTIWVDAATGSDISGDGSEENPYATIQTGIDAAESWDSVLVGPGTYSETIDFGGKEITLRSSTGPAGTIIQGTSLDTLVLMTSGEPPSTLISGFTLQGSAFGVVALGCGRIEGNVFANQDSAAILSMGGCDGLELGCDIIGNTIRNCGGSGIKFLSIDMPTVIRNNIIVDNGYGVYAIWGALYEPPAFEYNNVYGNTTNFYDSSFIFTNEIGYISLDPLFDTDGVSLTASSPCIDTGDPDTQYNDPNGTLADMGALPYKDLIGTFNENTTIDDSVYVVGDLIVPSGITLTIETDEVCIAPYVDSLLGGADSTKVEIRVFGELRLEGTEGTRIELGPDTAADSSWYGIKVFSGGHAYIDNAFIKNAYRALNLESEGSDTVINTLFEDCLAGIVTISDSAYIDHDTFTLTRSMEEGYGVYAAYADGNAMLSNCSFQNIRHPIRLYSSDMDISGCEFIEYDYHQAGSGGYPAIDLASGSDPSISDCIFNNYTQGIYVGNGCDIEVDNCVFESDSVATNTVPFMYIPLKGSPNSSSCVVRNSCFKPSQLVHVHTDTTEFDLGECPGDSGLNTFLLDTTSGTRFGCRPYFAVFNSASSTLEAEGNYWDSDAPSGWLWGTVDTIPSLASATGGCSSSGYPKFGVGSRNALASLPMTFEVRQNYPNPFNPTTVISFSLPEHLEVRLDIFNILGQRVRALVDKTMSPGDYAVEWDGRNETGYPVATGIYLYRLAAGEFVSSKKMMLIK